MRAAGAAVTANTWHAYGGMRGACWKTENQPIGSDRNRETLLPSIVDTSASRWKRFQLRLSAFFFVLVLRKNCAGGAAVAAARARAAATLPR